MSVTRGEQIQRFHTQQQAEGKKHNELQMCWLEKLTIFDGRVSLHMCNLLGTKMSVPLHSSCKYISVYV